MLFLCTFSFISCDDDNEQTNELTPEALYQTSWRGTGHCEAWTVQNMGCLLYTSPSPRDA